MESDINLIVAIGRDGAIGNNGDLLWNIPSDLKRFKSLTMGHPVIMGRKTWDSLPKKPLPGRRNIVLTRNKNFKAEGAEIVDSVEEAMRISQGDSPFIIGGAEIYKIFLPYVNTLFLTQVEAENPDADTRLNINLEDWRIIEESGFEFQPGAPTYRFVTLKRINENSHHK